MHRLVRLLLRGLLALYIAASIILLYIGMQLRTFSRWQLIADIAFACIAISSPSSIVQTPIYIMVPALSIGVAAFVTYLVVIEPALFQDAVETYGMAAVVVAHILLHYIPAIFNVAIIIAFNAHVRVRVAQYGATDFLVATMLVLCMSEAYAIFMNPIEAYKVTTLTFHLLTESAILSASAALAAVSIAFFLFCHIEQRRTSPRPADTS